MESRTLETITINNSLEIVRLNGNVKFKAPLGYTLPCGYCFKHLEKGYFAFAGDIVPYIPRGGKKALLSIMESGGFLDFDNSVWLQPLN